MMSGRVEPLHDRIVIKLCRCARRGRPEILYAMMGKRSGLDKYVPGRILQTELLSVESVRVYLFSQDLELFVGRRWILPDLVGEKQLESGIFDDIV